MAQHDSLSHYENGTAETAPLIHSERDALLGRPLSKTEERAGRIQFLALCWSLFMIGWNDGSIGPLLPRIMQVYDVCSFLCLNGSILQSVAFINQSLALSFPLFVAAFYVGGIGMAIQDAQANGYIATVKHNGELKMGFLQASYGFGALIAPISSTQFSQTTHWSFHYLVSFVLSISNLVILVAVFRFRGQDECLRESGEIVPEPVQTTVGDSKYSQMLRLKAVHLLALFLILYIGVEVTIGGWIVTFMIVVRGGGPSSGYIASGFFGGLTLGRIVLIWVNQKLGEVRAVYLYTVLVILFQFVVWLVPSIFVGSFAICFIGLLLGPMYPIAIRHAARVIPRPLVTGSIGWIAACGAAGSALLPFLTGALAEHLGIISLQPFLVVMMAVMGIVWFMVPTKPAEETFGYGKVTQTDHFAREIVTSFEFSQIIVIGSILQSACFIMQAFASSFSMFVAAFFIGGIGMAIEASCLSLILELEHEFTFFQDAQANGYVAMLRHDGELKMGLLQASYGLGALLSPLSATQFSQMTHWSFHFLISFALSITNSLALVAIFRFRGQDECLRKSGEVVPETVQSVGHNKYGQMLRLKAVHLLALFLIIYIGVEVTIGGWIVTFMINVRGGGPSSGYIASGFFGGLTLGRVILIWVTQKVGELRVVYLYMSLVILLQFVVWLVPSITIGSIAVFFIGLFLGPLCPIALRHAARVIPRPLVTGSIGYIAAYGAAGSALLPSLTGFLAENYGIISLQPFLIVMMVLMGLIWVMVPTTPAEGEER
ncbi:hypothetical protein CVT25_001472 [Psilocybe cyanescens]|uniref:Major facilitator superfamily (MFS) profile domain-containing protein n=1 Tax=Psilocybe cyanescens TaxID=93625 RepID=A0A409WNM3_PSICY|nr:hypothetical protein CVT25_001472 [Psilocybe cyanescens]